MRTYEHQSTDAGARRRRRRRKAGLTRRHMLAASTWIVVGVVVVLASWPGTELELFTPSLRVHLVLILHDLTPNHADIQNVKTLLD
jgi:hypothetical protein